MQFTIVLQNTQAEPLVYSKKINFDDYANNEFIESHGFAIIPNDPSKESTTDLRHREGERDVPSTASQRIPSVTPSAKKALSGSGDMFSNGSTAIDFPGSSDSA